MWTLLALAVTLAAALAAASCGESRTPPPTVTRATASREATAATKASEAGEATAAHKASEATAVPQASGTTAVPEATGATAASFAWLRPAPPPAAWRRARIETGAVLAYPPGWRTIGGDLGTATAGLRDARGRYLGYLNLTPRQGGETLADWASFRVAHQHEEGERDVQRLRAARDLPFGAGRASCVQDAYTTVIGARYVELACLVRGSRASTVVVGAALQSAWSAQRATLERAIAALST